jgi:hypothetical protein
MYQNSLSVHNCYQGRTDPCLELKQCAYRIDPNFPNRNVHFAQVIITNVNLQRHSAL